MTLAQNSFIVTNFYTIKILHIKKKKDSCRTNLRQSSRFCIGKFQHKYLQTWSLSVPEKAFLLLLPKRHGAALFWTLQLYRNLAEPDSSCMLHITAVMLSTSEVCFCIMPSFLSFKLLSCFHPFTRSQLLGTFSVLLPLSPHLFFIFRIGCFKFSPKASCSFCCRFTFEVV